ncbi:unnamed protein product [Auanema sp. JU1783]|nr:unnamed protein product [Auanema sp. JU1783]
MAELKSITGDEPYNGVGNAPAPIPQPMGFWGRPRYSPMSYQPGFGGGWYGASPMDRFTSFGHSPYGAEPGLHPFDMLSNLFSSVFDDDEHPRFSSASNPMTMRSANTISRNHSPSPSPSLSNIFSDRSSFSDRPAPRASASSGSSGLNLGGFYTGKGN